MEREDFLKKLGIGLVAVCAGCSLASCGGSKSSNPTPTPGGGTPPPATGTGNLFTADLGTEIKNIGDAKSSGGVILVRLAAANVAGSFTAVQMACTHEGNPIGYNSGQGIFICPTHGSHFSTSGAVLQGPAASSLKSYAVSITGTTLTVTA